MGNTAENQANEQIRNFTCQNHPDNQAKYYCKNCERVICSLCKEEHEKRSHQVEDCKSASLQLKSEVIYLDQEISEKLNVSHRINTAMLKLRVLIKNLESILMGKIREYLAKLQKSETPVSLENRIKKLEEHGSHVELCMLYIELKRILIEKIEKVKANEAIFKQLNDVVLDTLNHYVFHLIDYQFMEINGTCF